MAKKHIITALVENHPGVLSHISGLFARRGFNIDSLAVGRTERDDVSRMTIVVEGDDSILEKVTKQLNKLIDVIKVSDFVDTSVVDREMILIKVKASATTRSEIMQIVDIFRARIVDVSRESLIVEVTGDEGKLLAIIDLLRPFGIMEMVRTGKIALARGQKATTV
jgi:acetolactate synthase-1/3 small subunit